MTTSDVRDRGEWGCLRAADLPLALTRKLLGTPIRRKTSGFIILSGDVVRQARHGNAAVGNFANHCPHCGAIQLDLYLHCEPDDPFFDIPHAPAGSIKLTP